MDPKKLTDELIRSHHLPAKSYVTAWDTETKGFGARIYATGVRSFVLRYNTRSGVDRTYTIGRFGDWKTAAARKEAKRLKGEIRVNGADPAKELGDERSAPTMADLWERYAEEHLPTKRASSQREDRSIIAAHVFPALKQAKVAEVEQEDIERLHRKITKAGTPFRANRVVALLSSMFSDAVRWKLRADNPCKGIKRNPEEGRERYLEKDEIARLMKALAEHEDQEAANAIMLALLTGARRGELLSATWDQFDLAKGVWTKPSSHTKSKKTHRVPLSGAALQLLSVMRKRARKDQPHLFPGRINAAGRVDIRRPWEQVCLAAGLATLLKDGRVKPSIRFHDLRHSYASLLVSSGLSLPIIGKLLGHTQAATTQRYAHLADDPLRQATDIVGAIVAGKQ